MIKKLWVVLFLISNIASAEILSFGVLGDAGKWNDSTQSVRDSMTRNQVHRLVMPGDNLYGPMFHSYETEWGPWKKAGFSFDVVAIGNHTAGYKQEIDYFGMPGEIYSKVYGNTVRFIVLNSDNDDLGKLQGKWLEAELSQATEPLIFLVFHHPSLTVSSDHCWIERKKFQIAIRPLFWKYRQKITGLIVGHDHIAAMIHFNDLPVVLSGASHGFREDKPVNNVQRGINVRTDWFFDNAIYWTRLDIDTERKEAQVQYIRAQDDRISCTATLRTGLEAALGPECSMVQP